MWFCRRLLEKQAVSPTPRHWLCPEIGIKVDSILLELAHEAQKKQTSTVNAKEKVDLNHSKKLHEFTYDKMQMSCNIPRKPHASAARIRAEKSPFTWRRCQAMLKPHLSQIGLKFHCNCFFPVPVRRICLKSVWSFIVLFPFPVRRICLNTVWTFIVNLCPFPVRRICLKTVWSFIVIFLAFSVWRICLQTVWVSLSIFFPFTLRRMCLKAV